MATASVKLTLDNAEFMAKMAAANAKLAEFGATVRGLILSAAGLVAGLAGVYGAVRLVGKSIEEAANAEKLQVAFSTLIGNTKVAKATLADLVKFADSTPFELNQIAPAAKQLLAYGFAAKDLVPTLTMLGDVASALDVPLGELVEVFGRNIAQGRLFAKDLNEFQGRGIPIVENLAKVMGVTEQAVRDMTTAGTVGSRELMLAFQAMTGPGSRFGGMMAEQSKTFSGMLSNLKDRFDAVFREFGAPITQAMKPIFAWITANMGAIIAKAKEWGAAIGDSIGIIFEAFKQSKVGEILGLSIKMGAIEGIVVLQRGFAAAVAGLSAGMNAVWDSMSDPNGGLNYLADSDFWGGVAQLAIAAMGKVGMFLLDTIATAVSFLAAGFMKAGEELAERLPGGTKARSFGTIFDEARGNFTPGIDAMKKGLFDQFETPGVLNIDAAMGRAGSKPVDFVSKVSAAIADGFKNAPIDSAYTDIQASLRAEMGKLITGLSDSAKTARDAFKPAEKTGPEIRGKNFLEEVAASPLGKLDIIASSLAKVGGGGLTSISGTESPLLAEGKRQTAVLEEIRKNTAPRPGAPATGFTLTKRP